MRESIDAGLVGLGSALPSRALREARSVRRPNRYYRVTGSRVYSLLVTVDVGWLAVDVVPFVGAACAAYGTAMVDEGG